MDIAGPTGRAGEPRSLTPPAGRFACEMSAGGGLRLPPAAHTPPPTEAGAPLPKVQDSPAVPQRSWRSRLDPASCGQTRAAARGGGGRARRFQGMSWVEWVEPWASVLA